MQRADEPALAIHSIEQLEGGAALDLIGPLLGAIAGAAARPAGKIVLRGTRAIKRHLLGDHETIYRCWFRNDQGGRECIHVSICCAPSRRWNSPRPIDIDAAIEWTGLVFAGRFLEEPAFASPREQVRFESTDGAAALVIWPWGLIEATVPIPHRFDSSKERIQLVLTDISVPILEFAEGIAAGAHRRIFRLRRVGLPFRLDWHVGVSRALTLEHGWRPWDELLFPGRQPRPKPAPMHGPIPAPGYGEERLRGQLWRTPGDIILREVLDDLIVRSGYRNYKDALTDVMEAV